MPLNLTSFPFAQVEPGGAREMIDTLARTPLSKVLIVVAVLTAIRLALYPILRNTKPHLRGGGYGFARFFNEILDAFVYAGVFVFMIIRPFGVQAFLIPTGSMWPTLHVNDFIVANKAVYRYSEPQFGDVAVFKPPVRAAYENQKDENGEVKVDFIKRVIGTPGDLIEIKEGVLFRNGEKSELQFRNYSECVVPEARAQNCQVFRALEPSETSNMTMASFKLVKHDGQLIPLNYTSHDANSTHPIGSFGDITAPYDVHQDFEIPDPAQAQALAKAPAEKIPPGFFLMMGDNRNGSFDGRGWGLVPREAIIGRSEFIWLPPSRWQRTR